MWWSVNVLVILFKSRCKHKKAPVHRMHIRVCKSYRCKTAIQSQGVNLRCVKYYSFLITGKWSDQAPFPSNYETLFRFLCWFVLSTVFSLFFGWSWPRTELDWQIRKPNIYCILRKIDVFCNTIASTKWFCLSSPESQIFLNPAKKGHACDSRVRWERRNWQKTNTED